MTEPAHRVAPGRVGPVARLLGFAGLLPPLLAVTGLAAARGQPLPLGPGPFVVLAIVYPLVILSFLGGMWWGFAMQREAGQGRLAALAVAPSLAVLLLLALFTVTDDLRWTLVAIGSAVLLTLPVDRHLVATGEAPTGWMGLRVPLSVGLGGLTILAGTLMGAPAF